MRPGNLVLPTCKIFLAGAPMWSDEGNDNNRSSGRSTQTGFLRENEIGLVLKRKKNIIFGNKVFVLGPKGELGWIYENDLGVII